MTDLLFHKTPTYDLDEIERGFNRLRLPLEIIDSRDIETSARAFRGYLQDDSEWMKYYEGLEGEKWIEHFLSYHFLQPTDGIVVLDAASHWSPYYRILKKLHNVEVYLQDLCFDAGIHENRIGSDCTNIPLPDASVDLIAVNNSIEHFEGIRDILFIQEAYRLLKPGGRLCIVPLWMNSRMLNLADPNIDLSGVRFDAGALLVSCAPWKLRFSRVYSPDSFYARVVRAMAGFDHRIISIHDLVSFDPKIHHWNFVGLLTKTRTA